MLAEPAPKSIIGRFDDARAAFVRVRDLSTHSTDAYHADLPGGLLTTYPGPRHLASLLLATHDGIASAALTAVPPPAGADANFWRAWLRHRAEAAPFTWPNHRIAIAKGFYETGRSANSRPPHWCRQNHGIRTQDCQCFGTRQEGRISCTDACPRGSADGRPSGDVPKGYDRHGSFERPWILLFALGSQLQKIEVMTPERCLALLSFSPEAFAYVGLLVFDECHLLSPKAGKLEARLWTACFAYWHLAASLRRPNFLFLSAMLRNGEQFSRWIERLTGRSCLFIDPSVEAQPSSALASSYTNSRVFAKSVMRLLRFKPPKISLKGRWPRGYERTQRQN